MTTQMRDTGSVEVAATGRGDPPVSGGALVPTFPVRRQKLLTTLTVAGVSGGVGASRVGYEMALSFIDLGGRLVDVEVLDCACDRDDLLAGATGGGVVLVCRPDQIGKAADLVAERPAAVSAVVVSRVTPERLRRSQRLQLRALSGRVVVGVLPHVRDLAARQAPRGYGFEIKWLCKRLQLAQTIVVDANVSGSQTREITQ